MKWNIFGLPFSYHQSSCSNMKPKMFSWQELYGDVELWVDSAIEQGLTTQRNRKKKYAWICESRSIIPFFSNLYSLDDKGNMVVNGITPILQDMIDEYDLIFTCDKDIVKLHDKIRFCYAGSTLPWTKKENRSLDANKYQLCSFISSNKNMCKGHQMRHDLHDLLKSEFGKPSESNTEPAVHVCGSIIGEPFGSSVAPHLEGGSPYWHDKTSGISPYVYSIIMENDSYKSYFTEKITDCFALGTIPIYWGAPDIGDYFDIDGIIQVDNIEEIVTKLRWLNIPENRNRDIVTRKNAMLNNLKKIDFLESPDDMLYRKIMEDVQ